MSPIQQMLLGMGAVAKKTYVDDIFSTYLWTGSGSARSINNGIDLSGEGGMTWIKKRNTVNRNVLTDTVRGVTKQLFTERTDGEDTQSDNITSFNNNGFSLDTDGRINENGHTYSSWSFRKSKGFFDCITFSGNGNLSRQISHNLECKPGMVLLKRTDGQYGWYLWHRKLNGGNDSFRYFIRFDNEGQTDANSVSNSPIQAVSSTTVTLTASSGWDGVNTSGQSYVMYVFAGNEEQGNASVEIDGGNDNYLEINASSDFVFDGQFCIEYWVYMDDNSGEEQILSWGSGAYRAIFWTGSTWKIEWPTNSSNFDLGGSAPTNTWKHHVITRDSSNVVRFFIDGVLQSNQTTSDDIGENSKFVMGIKYNHSSAGLKGKLSNVRLVKGSIPTTYQTSSTTNTASIFTSPTTPLSTTSQGATESDVKLLCCNDIGASGFTKSPKPIVVIGTPQGNTTSSPFAASTATDASAIFGKSGDQNIIKCGCFQGNGSSTGPKINLGWEPSWIMVKNISTNSRDWVIWDSMRGISTGGNDPRLKPNSNEAEGENNAVDLTSTGFNIVNTAANWNQSGDTIIYMAIRRPDGYVGKPADAATDVFTMDWGNSTSTESWTSGFPIDFAIYRRTHYVDNWFASARLMQGDELVPNTTAAEAAWTGAVFDSNTAWGANSGMDTSYLSYMWKRHKGFDVQRYTGRTGQQSRVHGLSAVPEMIWAKSTNNNYEWAIGHKDLTSGWTSKHLRFTNSAEITGQQFALAPTSTHWTTPNGALVNDNGEEYIAMLFASVDGISKVGSYTGDGNSTRWINVGFQPRFLLLKDADNTGDWLLVDSERGVDKNLYLNTTAANSGGQKIATSSTSFAIMDTSNFNASGDNYIYYAHA